MCFISRATILYLNVFQVAMSENWWFDLGNLPGVICTYSIDALVYFSLLECLPLLLMIVILHTTREPKLPDHHAALINEKQLLYAT